MLNFKMPKEREQTILGITFEEWRVYLYLDTMTFPSDKRDYERGSLRKHVKSCWENSQILVVCVFISFAW